MHARFIFACALRSVALIENKKRTEVNDLIARSGVRIRPYAP